MRTLIVIMALCIPMYAQAPVNDPQFPDAPEPIKYLPHGGIAHDKAGELPKFKVFDRYFVISHGAYLAANVFDIEMTHQGLARRKCVEGGFDGEARPSRGELYAVDMTIFAAITGFDYLIYHGFRPAKWDPIRYILPSYGTAVHLKGGIDWYSRCW